MDKNAPRVYNESVLSLSVLFKQKKAAIHKITAKKIAKIIFLVKVQFF